jgi:hypothetical protein
MYSTTILLTFISIVASNRFGVFFNRHILSKSKIIFPTFFICPRELEPYEVDWFLTSV